MALRTSTVVLVVLAMTGCKPSGPKLDPESGYAKLRPGIVKAATEFPADPDALARCSPGLGRVVLLTLGNVAPALKVPLGKSQRGLDVRTYADEHLEHLERNEFDDYNYGSFRDASRFAVFSTVASTVPQAKDCERVENPNQALLQHLNCKLTPGLFDGSLVVFEPTGRPTCAVRVKVEGPAWVSGSYGVASDMSGYVHEVLRALFDVEGAEGTWLAKLPPGRQYTVTVEGVVLREPVER